MKRTLTLTLLFAILLTGTLFSQIPNGSIAPNWTGTDLDGNTHNLYDLLADGKSVVLDFSATWCGPCWSYKNTGTLDELMEHYGPGGTDEVMVFFIEADVTTTLADLQGTGPQTVGDWITGTNHPIIDNAAIASMYQIGSYPTLIKICPDRLVEKISTGLSADQIVNLGRNCPSIDVAPVVEFRADNYDGCESLDVNFYDNSWPRPDVFEWSFGDGGTSNEMNPSHSYETPGTYSVTLIASNGNGETTLEKTEFIHVGEGNPYAGANVGAESKDIGTGRYFEGGHQALVFDVYEPIVIENVKVFSDKAAERLVVLKDENGTLVNERLVFIEEGEHVIDLNLYVPAGTGFTLGLHSDAYLFRNDAGVQYPYDLGNLMSIRTSTAGQTPENYYYYYYDWNVRKAGCEFAVAVNELASNSFNLFPNPSSTELYIQLSDDVSQADVQIFDFLGKSSLLLKDVSQTTRVETATFDAGIYTVVLTSEGKISTQKLIIER